MSPMGREVVIEKDPETLLTTQVRVPGLAPTSYGYDINGRLTSQSTGQRTQLFDYDANGFISGYTAEDGRVTRFEHDPVGRISRIERPDTGELQFTYDNNGNMIVFTNPLGVNHEFEYNNINLPSSHPGHGSAGITKTSVRYRSTHPTKASFSTISAVRKSIRSLQTANRFVSGMTAPWSLRKQSPEPFNRHSNTATTRISSSPA